MPNTRLDTADIRQKLKNPSTVANEAFSILKALCAATADSSQEVELRELVLRLLDHQDQLVPYREILASLIRHVGLFPYLTREDLSGREWLAFEAHRPDNMGDEIVLHRAQARIYYLLKSGCNVALSAPTSFGKSLLVDAAIATGSFSNIAIVVPTLALVDETRRRMTRRFGKDFKIITHSSQALGVKNIFVLTQERAIDFPGFPTIDLLVVDEFYKLAPERDDDGRCAMLNHALYRLLKISKQFYMLGPFILGLSEQFRSRFSCVFVKEDFHTVASDLHRVTQTGYDGANELDILIELCRSFTDPTIVFCRSPARATEVANALVRANLGLAPEQAVPAAEWIARHYHPDWHFAHALRNGVGVHHGRIPRSLGQMVVRLFNGEALRFLVCTSTLIEGVNTRAKNIVVFDNSINRIDIDLFTFNNIRGRAGRMREHFVGNVYVFHSAPQLGLPFVDVPAFSQNENAPDSLLIQLDDGDLLDSSRKRLAPYKSQSVLPYETLKENIGIDPAAQLEFSKRISSLAPDQLLKLSWVGMPNYDELKFVCEMIWDVFDGSRLGSGSVRSASQLTFFINRLRSSPTVASLVQQSIKANKTPDQAVAQVIDFLRLWAQFHFPRLLRAIDRIQREMLPRFGLPPGNYEIFAGKVESFFLDSALVALDEYGVPTEIARKLRRQLERDGDLDLTLKALKLLDVENCGLDKFERDMIREAQADI